METPNKKMVPILAIIGAVIAFSVIGYLALMSDRHSATTKNSNLSITNNSQANRNLSGNGNTAGLQCETDRDCVAACGRCVTFSVANQLLCATDTNPNYTCTCTSGSCVKAVLESPDQETTGGNRNL